MEPNIQLPCCIQAAVQLVHETNGIKTPPDLTNEEELSEASEECLLFILEQPYLLCSRYFVQIV